MLFCCCSSANCSGIKYYCTETWKRVNQSNLYCLQEEPARVKGRISQGVCPTGPSWPGNKTSRPSVHCPLFTAPCPLSTVHWQLPTVYGPLSNVHCPLSTAHCQLSTVHCPLSTTAHFPLSTAHCQWPTSPFPLPTVHCTLSSRVGRFCPFFGISSKVKGWWFP